jgi:hypothetical protein
MMENRSLLMERRNLLMESRNLLMESRNLMMESRDLLMERSPLLENPLIFAHLLMVNSLLLRLPIQKIKDVMKS